MTTIHARTALTPDGWRNDVRLKLDGGRIAAVELDVQAAPNDERVAILIPATAAYQSDRLFHG